MISKRYSHLWGLVAAVLSMAAADDCETECNPEENEAICCIEPSGNRAVASASECHHRVAPYAECFGTPDGSPDKPRPDVRSEGPLFPDRSMDRPSSDQKGKDLALKDLGTYDQGLKDWNLVKDKLVIIDIPSIKDKPSIDWKPGPEAGNPDQGPAVPLFTKSAGGPGMDSLENLVIDSLGQVYIAGTFSGSSLTLGSTTLTSKGGSDMFVAKLDSVGTFLWAQAYGGSGQDLLGGLALTSTDELVLVGSFSGTVDFGKGNVTSAGQTDAVVVKLKATGATEWVTTGGSTGPDFLYDVALDSKDNPAVIGTVMGSSTFGTTSLTGAGKEDMLVARVSSTGGFTTAMALSSASSEMGRTLTVDPTTDMVYAAGSFSGPLVVGGKTLTPTTASDDLLLQMDKDLKLVTERAIPNVYYTNIRFCYKDLIAAVGKFDGTVVHGSQTLTSKGGSDGLVAAYDAKLVPVWAAAIGGSGKDIVTALTVDPTSKIVFVAGGHEAAFTYASKTVPVLGNSDIFVAAMDSTVKPLWISSGGGTGWDSVSGLGRGANALFVSGNFENTATFGSTSLTSGGNSDFFVAKTDLKGQFK